VCIMALLNGVDEMSSCSIFAVTMQNSTKIRLNRRLMLRLLLVRNLRSRVLAFLRGGLVHQLQHIASTE